MKTVKDIGGFVLTVPDSTAELEQRIADLEHNQTLILKRIADLEHNQALILKALKIET